MRSTHIERRLSPPSPAGFAPIVTTVLAGKASAEGSIAFLLVTSGTTHGEVQKVGRLVSASITSLGAASRAGDYPLSLVERFMAEAITSANS